MDRHAVWPDFQAVRVVHEDDALLVVDKPAGVPSQRSREDVADDLPTRLQAFLSARDGRRAADVYLGIHQRLDRATSGVLAYAKRKEANASLARQLEGRTADKRYVACVASFPKATRATTLRDRLAPDDDGRMVRASPRDRRGVDAVTHVEVIEREGSRALLALRLETGRTHQARAQLAIAGSPIAGDRLYGEGPGACASRLMLHARSIELAHPIDGRRVIARADVPRAFSRYLAHGDVPVIPEGGALDAAALADALELAREERFGLGRSTDTTAFRLVHEGGDALPGLAVDVYGDHLVAHLYDPPVLAAEAPLLDALDALGFDGVYVKRRPKQANTLVDTRNDAVAPRQPLRGRGPLGDEEIEILEHGIPYLVRLGDGLSTGIFLDQRENRRRLRAMAGGKRVLNLFAYTCPFTIAAAAGGASRTVSVDASSAALERGARGLAHAGLAGDHHALVVDDVFAWLERAAKKQDRFDVVLLDPPSYSTAFGTRFSTSSDYQKLAALAMRVVAKDGVLLACSNHRQTVQAKLRRLLHEASRSAERPVAKMIDQPPPIDFPPPFGAQPHLKSVLVRVG